MVVGRAVKPLRSIGKVTLWYILPVLLTALFPAIFYYDICHYMPHDDGRAITAVILFVPAAVICIKAMKRAAERQERAGLILYGLALASCVFFLYWFSRIPFCAMCDRIGKDDLGFMLRPFANELIGH